MSAPTRPSPIRRVTAGTVGPNPVRRAAPATTPMRIVPGRPASTRTASAGTATASTTTVSTAAVGTASLDTAVLGTDSPTLRLVRDTAARPAAARPVADAAPAGATPAERAVTAAAATVDPISLDELNALAELQTRVDRKYFVPAEVFQRLIAALGDDIQVLDMGGRRTFGYESVYFDTPELSTYKAHVQGRRARFKARTRTYTDTGLCMFEVKVKGARGETVKQRVPHPEQYRAELTEDALAHLATTLREAYHQDAPADMRPTLVTTYRRTTFVTRSGDARLTCDTGLVCLDLEREVRDTGTHVLVESKSAGQGGSVADRFLRELGVRPVSVSKYAVAVAALHPELPSNPWHRTLRRYFSPLQVAAA